MEFLIVLLEESYKIKWLKYQEECDITRDRCTHKNKYINKK